MPRITSTCVSTLLGARDCRLSCADAGPAPQYLNKPAWDPLLPPPLPEPHYRPYTLVIDLEDMLTHDKWDVRRNTLPLSPLSRRADHVQSADRARLADSQAARRRLLPRVPVPVLRDCPLHHPPVLRAFCPLLVRSLGKRGSATSSPSHPPGAQLAIPQIEQIDPYGAYIPWKLFKEATRYKNNAHIKDLSYLNRPLERTVVLDIDPERVQLQPDNAIVLKPWQGTKGDATANELVAMIPFLEALAIKGVKDVRPVIKHYEGKHIPTAYAEAEARTKKELLDKWEAEKRDTSVKGWIGSLFGGLTKVRPALPLLSLALRPLRRTDARKNTAAQHRARSATPRPRRTSRRCARRRRSSTSTSSSTGATTPRRSMPRSRRTSSASSRRCRARSLA